MKIVKLFVDSWNPKKSNFFKKSTISYKKPRLYQKNHSLKRFFCIKNIYFNKMNFFVDE